MAQILDTLGAVEGGLRCRKPNALQHRTNRDSQMRADLLGQERSLIKTTLALPRRVQWNGNDYVESAFAEPGIIQRSYEPATDEMAKMNLFSVFEI